MGIGSVSGLKSFLALLDWEGLGEGDEDILSLREKSSGSASGVGRAMACGFRGEEGDCRRGTEAIGFGFDMTVCCVE
jgi:hypothetical protein